MIKLGCSMSIVWILIVLLCCVGWIKCIIKELNCDFEPSYKAEIIYGVGIIIPVAGGVIGWFDIKDEKVIPIVNTPVNPPLPSH